MADPIGLHITLADGILRITFDRPEVRNALNGAMVLALTEALEGAQADPDVRVVVLQGNGGAFSAGADIGGDAVNLLGEQAVLAANRMIRAITSLAKPVVAVVDGPAAGVGCSIALAADVIVATERSTFQIAFSSIGLMPDGGSTATLAASLGRASALRMALLGEPLTAQVAYDAGLVASLGDPEPIVAHLAAGPPLAQAAIKKAINATTLTHLEDAFDRERVSQTILLKTGDFVEGATAFLEHRPPRFEGR